MYNFLNRVLKVESNSVDVYVKKWCEQLANWNICRHSLAHGWPTVYAITLCQSRVLPGHNVNNWAVKCCNDCCKSLRMRDNRWCWGSLPLLALIRRYLGCDNSSTGANHSEAWLQLYSCWRCYYNIYILPLCCGQTWKQSNNNNY